MGSMKWERFRIGVDVGGTNTDAALVGCSSSAADQDPNLTVLASSKSPTTSDVTSGICNAVRDVIQQAAIPHKDVLSINIGTTHFINAVTQRDSTKLNRVAVLRLCGPFGREIAPFADWPRELRNIVEGPVGYFSGGLEIDGRNIGEVKDSEIRQFAQSLKQASIKAAVVIGVFSSLDPNSPTQEEYVRNLLVEEITDLQVVCSRDVGNSPFIERENAAILNASILEFGRRTIQSFERAFHSLDLDCPLYLTQNDGTVMETDTAMRLPIKTFSSGATNSLTGALFLSGIRHGTTDIDPSKSQVIMVDIGGTTSDFAALSPSGFPRQSPATVQVGGVRTAFSMPELVSIGLGGGSHVVEQEDGRVTVGPTSVGYQLASLSQCFGGSVLTASDIVVASGRAEDISGSASVSVGLDVVEKARHSIKRQLERSIDNMKVSDQEVVLLLVGGGSIVQLDDLDNVKACIRPPFCTVANAVGAAIAKISGEVDKIVIPGDRKQEAIVEEMTAEAVEATCRHGAIRETVKIVEVDCIPLQYATNAAFRVVIRACGDLGWQQTTAKPRKALPNDIQTTQDTAEGTIKPLRNIDREPEVDFATYKPEVSENGEWFISESDLAFIAEGCGVLGTGGGGSVHSAYLQSIQTLRSLPKGRMRVVDPKSIDTEARVAIVAFVGAPTVSNERLAGEDELRIACDKLAQYLQLPAGSASFAGLTGGEIGGSNGMRAFATAASMDLPVLDADALGRAFPKVDMCLPFVYGAERPAPAVLADARGNAQIVAEVESADRLERLLRCVCIELGLFTAFAHGISGGSLRDYTCHDTISQAWHIGRAIMSARQRKVDVVQSLVELIPGCKSLYTGRIVGISREVKGGWTVGTATLQRAGDDEVENSSEGDRPDTRPMVLQYQNEFLYAALQEPDGSQDTICTTPDLITVLDTSGTALSTHELRYGLLVSVIAMPAHPLWTTAQGMQASNPASFGLDMDYRPFGVKWTPTPSVIQQYMP